MYIHTQNTLASTWFVNHEMGEAPVVEVLIHYNGKLHKVLPTRVFQLNDDVAVIEFASARTGIVNVLGPLSGTNAGDEPFVPPLDVVLRAFDPNQTIGLTLSNDNQTVLGSGGSRSVVARSGSGKYQYKMFFDNPDTSAIPPNIYIGLGSRNTVLWDRPFDPNLGDTVAFASHGNSSFYIASEYMESDGTNLMLEHLYNTSGTVPRNIEVLVSLDLDSNTVRFRVSGPTDPESYEHVVNIPPDQTWFVYYRASNPIDSLITFDFIGSTFNADTGYQVWDVLDDNEAPPPPPEPLLRGFDPSTTTMTLQSNNTIVSRSNSSIGNAALSVVSRGGVNAGKYQFRVFGVNVQLTANWPSITGFGLVNPNSDFDITQSPFSQRLGNKVMFYRGSSGRYSLTGEFADSSLPQRYFNTPDYPSEISRIDPIDVLLDLDNNTVTFKILNVGYEETISIPPNEVWSIWMYTANWPVVDIKFDFVGESFTPEIGYEVWDLADNLENPDPLQYPTNIAPFVGVNKVGNFLSLDESPRPVSVLSGNGALNSITPRFNGGKYQFRVYNEGSFLNSPIAWRNNFGIATITTPTNTDPIRLGFAGDTVVLANPNPGQIYRPISHFAETELPGNITNYAVPSDDVLNREILDVLLDLDNNTVTFRLTNDGSNTFDVESFQTYTQTIDIPANKRWYAYMFLGNSLADIAYDLAGYRFEPDLGYVCWDDPSQSSGIVVEGPETLMEYRGWDPAVGGSFLRKSDRDGVRAVVSGNGIARSLTAHTQGKHQYRIFCEESISSIVAHKTYYGIITDDGPTSGSNPFSLVATGAVAALSRDLSTHNHSTRYRFDDASVTDQNKMAEPLRRDHIIDILLDLDLSEVTFRVSERGVLQLEGSVIYEHTITIPSGLAWHAMMYNANSIANTVYDFAGYRFEPDVGFQVWDDIPPPPTYTLRGFNIDDKTSYVELADNNTRVLYGSGPFGSFSNETIRGYVRSSIGRSTSGKYQIRLYHDSTSPIVIGQFSYGISTNTFTPSNGSGIYGDFAGDKVALTRSSGYEVEADFSDSTYGGRFLSTYNQSPNIPVNQFEQDDVIDILLDLNNNTVRFMVNDGVKLDHTVIIPPNRTWYIYANSIYRNLIGDFIGTSFTPTPGYVAWDVDGNEGVADTPLTSHVPVLTHSLRDQTTFFAGDNRPVNHIKNSTSRTYNILKSSIIREGGGKYQFRVYAERGSTSSFEPINPGAAYTNTPMIGICSTNFQDRPFTPSSFNEEGNTVALSGFSTGQPWEIISQYANLTLPDRGNSGYFSNLFTYNKEADTNTILTEDSVVDVLLDLDNNQMRFIVREGNVQTFSLDQAIVSDVTVPIVPDQKWVFCVMNAKALPLVVDTAGYKFDPVAGYQPWDVVDTNITTIPTPELTTLVPFLGFTNDFNNNGKRTYLLVSGEYRSVSTKTSGKYQYRVYHGQNTLRTRTYASVVDFGVAETTLSGSIDSATTVTGFGAMISPINATSTKVVTNDNGAISTTTVNQPLRYSDVVDVLLDLDNNTITFRTYDVDWENYRIEGDVVIQETVTNIPANKEWSIHVRYGSNFGDTYYDTAGYRFNPDPGFKVWDDETP